MRAEACHEHGIAQCRLPFLKEASMEKIGEGLSSFVKVAQTHSLTQVVKLEACDSLAVLPAMPPTAHARRFPHRPLYPPPKKGYEGY